MTKLDRISSLDDTLLRMRVWRKREKEKKREKGKKRKRLPRTRNILKHDTVIVVEGSD